MNPKQKDTTKFVKKNPYQKEPTDNEIISETLFDLHVGSDLVFSYDMFKQFLKEVSSNENIYIKTLGLDGPIYSRLSNWQKLLLSSEEKENDQNSLNRNYQFDLNKEEKQGKEYINNILEEKIEYCIQEINKLKKDNKELKEMIYNDSVSYGSDSRIRTIPIEIFLDTNDSEIIFGVYESVLFYLDSIGFEKTFEFEAVKGSWFKRLLANSKEVLTSDEVGNRIKEVEYSIEVNTILLQQSEIDKNQSEALLNILKAVENVPNAAIRIGSLLVVKLTSRKGNVNVQVRSLSIRELHLLNKRPELLHNPQLILSALTKELNKEDEFPQISNN